MFLLIGSSVKSSWNKIAFRCLRDMYSFTVKVSLLIGLVYVLWVRLYIHMCKGICIWGSTYPTPNPVIHSLNLKKFKAQKLWNVEISVTLQLYRSIRNAVTCTKYILHFVLHLQHILHLTLQQIPHCAWPLWRECGSGCACRGEKPVAAWTCQWLYSSRTFVKKMVQYVLFLYVHHIEWWLPSI